MFDIAVFASPFVTLLVIMAPTGVTPLLPALTGGRPAKVQRKMAFQADSGGV
ncbi:antibiotic resistance protein MarC, partial [Streptomyces albidoflavus]